MGGIEREMGSLAHSKTLGLILTTILVQVHLTYYVSIFRRVLRDVLLNL